MRKWRAGIGTRVLATALFAAGCASHHQATPTRVVELPPLVDLREYPVVGLVEFASVGQPALGRETSARFLSVLQSWQPGVRVLELGSEAEVCAALGRDALGFEAIREIGARYGVAAVLSGRVDVGAVTPQIQVARFLRSASVATGVEASLVARLQETATGATSWTGSSRAGVELSRASLGRAHAEFDPGNPDAAASTLVRDLVDGASPDFRPRYERR